MTVMALPVWFPLLQERLQEFYVMPPNGPGKVRLEIQTPEQDWGFIVSMGESQLDITVLAEGDAAVAVETQANLRFNEEVLRRALEYPEDLEPRADYFGRNVLVSGDMGLVQFFTQLLKRPSEYDLGIFKHVRNHPNQPDHVHEMAGLHFPVLLDSLVNNQACVVRQAFDWPAQQWSPEEFRHILGKIVLRFNAKTQREDTLGDLLDEMQQEGSRRVYSSGRSLPDSAQHHFPIPPDVAEFAGSAHIWIGKSQAGRLVSKLHADVYTSLLTQVWGKKTVYLYTPADYDRLNPVWAFCGYLPFYFNPLEPDYDRYPKAKGLGCFKVDLMPGDMLMIPSGWPHAVEVDGWTMSISRAVALEQVNAHYAAMRDVTGNAQTS